ncbi:MAG TPA: PaaI family thioesterase [Egibacteraceae bacterium]|nr:PaaI family thioesterase [Egibacteraceae bacterium]
MTVRERLVRWEDPAAAAEQGLALAGLDYLRGMIDGALPHPPICATLGFRVAEAEEGRCVIALEPGEHQYNPLGSVHGSVVVAALDSAAGNAVHSVLPAGVGYTTVDLTTTFLRAVTAQTGTLYCEGTLIHAGRRIALSEAKLRDAEGTLYAHGTTTCMVLGG